MLDKHYHLSDLYENTSFERMQRVLEAEHKALATVDSFWKAPDYSALHSHDLLEVASFAAADKNLFTSLQATELQRLSAIEAAAQIALSRHSQIDAIAQHIVSPRYFADAVFYAKQDWSREVLKGPTVHLQDIVSSLYERANLAALTASQLPLSNVLESYRTRTDDLVLKLMRTDFGWWSDTRHLATFAQTCAFSNMLAVSPRVSTELYSAKSAILDSELPPLPTLAEHRRFLDAAGLTLPRWPRLLLRDSSERRQRFALRLRENAEAPHERQAKSLVHKYERVLREIIEEAMIATFGDDWAESRLPLCGCNDLLGKWRDGGGSVLSHADYFHYGRIMCHPEHFESVFSVGFANPDELSDLLKAARKYRATSHHARPFTPDDLRELRIVWRTIEAGLVALQV